MTALSDTQLNFINRSDNVNNINVVVFQQNLAEDFGERTIAWTVIENCGQLDTYPFVYPLNFQVSACDAYGNHTPRQDATDGMAFEMVKDTSGDILRIADTPAASPAEVEIRNNLIRGAIHANVYRDGRLLASKTNVAPGQEAIFQIYPRIYIGIVPQIVESQVIPSAVVKRINTEFNLFGIASADIVMTGGGKGRSALPFEFHMENINTV